MFAVGDDFRGQVVEEERRFHHAAAHRVGLLFAQPGAVGHGAEQMIDVRDAPATGRLHLRERGVRVADVDADIQRPAGADERLGAGQLRGDGGAADAVAERQVFEVFFLPGRPHVLAGMTAARLLREVRTVEMRAEDAGAAGAFLLEPLAHAQEGQVLLVLGDRGGGQQAGGAVAGVGQADGPEGLFGAVHEVVPCPAVHVQIDEPWHQVAVGQIDDARLEVDGRRRLRDADHGDALADRLHLAVVDQTVRQNDGPVGEEQVHDRRPRKQRHYYADKHGRRVAAASGGTP